jgi:hypothetical protein
MNTDTDLMMHAPADTVLPNETLCIHADTRIYDFQRKALVCLIVLFSLCLLFLNSQTLFAQHTSNPKAHKKDLQEVKTYAGHIVNWSVDDSYFYNGFYFQTKDKKYLVKIPLYMAEELTKTSDPEALVYLKAAQPIGSSDETILQFSSITAGPYVIYVKPEVKDTTAPFREYVNGSGIITEIQKKKDGVVIGYVVDKTIILNMPAIFAQRLDKVIIVGDDVSYGAVKEKAHSGMVVKPGFTVLHCETLSVRGAQYLAQ